jgi:hypothetical protein
MATEIPRHTDQLDHYDEDDRDQDSEASDGTRTGAEPEEGEDQKKGNET